MSSAYVPFSEMNKPLVELEKWPPVKEVVVKPAMEVVVKPVKEKLTHKACTKCGNVLPITEFLSRNGKTKYPQCPQCRRASNHKEYRENRKKHLPRGSVKLQLLEMLNATSCSRCGYSEFISALEFHHRNPRMKDSQVSQAIGAYSIAPTEDKWERILAEAAKCDVLCSNCHQALHYGDW